MYLGNSRMLLGKNTNQKAIGDWLAVAPSNASSGTSYGIDNGSGYCSEIFNGYLYVGGQFTQLINNTTTSTANNLIKYNLGDSNAVWENAVNTNEGTIRSLRDIAAGDHLLVSAADSLFYITETSSLTANSVTNSGLFYSGLSNTFDTVNINGTTYSATNSSKLCVANRTFDSYQIYDGGAKGIIFTSSSFLFPNSADSHYVETTSDKKILTILRQRSSTRKSILSRTVGYLSYTAADEPNDQTTIDSDYHNMCFSNPTVFPNRILVAAADFNKISVFNYFSERWVGKINIPANLGNITTLNEVLYNNINFLIVGGSTGIFLVNPSDTSSTKPIFMPTTDPRINSISVGSDSTIYVTGSFSFVDKNGVTAKNIAKFVPDASKLP